MINYLINSKKNNYKDHNKNNIINLQTNYALMEERNKLKN